MEFGLSAEQREIQALAREVAGSEIEPNAAAWDREHRFPAEVIAKLGELGLMGVCVPDEHGGAGADFLSYILVLEELSRADAGVGVTVAVHTSAATLPILAFGDSEQKARFVPPLARGEVLGAFALTEPGSGSDAGSLRTAASPDGDGWTISGSKQWITNGTHAGTFILFARSDPDTPAPEGVPSFFSTPGPWSASRRGGRLGRTRPRPPPSRPEGPALTGIGYCMRRARASRWRWRPWTRGGSGSQHRPSASPRQRSTRPAHTRSSGVSSVGASAISRPSSGSSPIWRPRSTRRACSRTV